MRAIVTGGAGFIGSHLVDALVARGDDVVVVDSLATGKRERLNDGARLVVEDIRDAQALDEAFREARPDVCFHLAAQADVRRSVEEPVFDGDVNVLGTVGVLEAARAHGTQVVFSSTGGAIYGECERPGRPRTRPCSRSLPTGPRSSGPRSTSRTYNRLYGTRHVALRYGNVYGPRQDPHGEAGVVAIFFGRIVAGERPRIFGDGTPDARLRLRGRRRRGHPRGPPGQPAASSTSGPDARPRSWSCTRCAAG